MSLPTHCLCHVERSADESRRKVIKLAVAGMGAPFAFASSNAHSKPAPGDRLVEEDAEGPPKPLRLSDLTPGKPLLAFPFAAASGVVRNDSRLNKIVLMRFPEAELDAQSRARSAGGVLAFSAICTHQACDVKTWLSKEKVLVCFCHSSKFNPLDGASVTSGPAPRSLPDLPLSLEGDELVVAGTFTSKPGPG